MIEVNNSPEAYLALLVTSCVFAIGLFLIIRPHKAIGLIVRWLRIYQRVFDLSDHELDKIGFPIQRSLLGGSVSRFVQTGAQRPDLFPTAVAYVRMFGSILALVCGSGLFLGLVFYVLSLFVGRKP